MSLNNFYIYLSSKNNMTPFTTNTPQMFNTLLLKDFNLHGHYECALIEITITGKFKEKEKQQKTVDNLCVYCDVVDYSFRKGHMKQILRKLPEMNFKVDEKQKYFLLTSPYYLKVIKTQLNTILITLLDDDLDLSGVIGCVDLVLHFRKIKNGRC